MKCSYCQIDFHAEFNEQSIKFPHSAKLPKPSNAIINAYAMSKATTCPGCGGAHIFIRIYKYISQIQEDLIFLKLVYPHYGSTLKSPQEVPHSIAADFTEAAEVIQISAKASAALSRRCLQAILSSHGYLGRDLVKQIDAVLSEKDTTKALPTSIRENIDAIRNFGNFSAHPITDTTSLQIVDVETGEADWCLQILLDLFDHYYVSPAKAATKRAALTAKLAATGKPPIKL